MNQEQAKRNLKRYKTVDLISRILGLVVYIICCVLGGIKLFIPALIFYLILVACTNKYLNKKYIYDPLSKHMNAPLFHETVLQGNFYSRSAMFQIQSEYFIGEYENVISICLQKLKDPKIAKKFKYYYLIHLANVYFDIGDNNALGEICEEFYNELEKESAGRSKNILKKFSRIAFYKSFVEGDFDSCYFHTYKTEAQPISQIKNTYFKARVALCKNELEEATKHFRKIIEKAPHINYAELSRHGLESIEKNVPYQDTFEELDATKEFILSPQPRSLKIRKALFIAACIIFVALFIVNITNLIIHQQRFNAFREEARLLLEEEYDDVQILDTFNLLHEGKIVDSIYLAKTSTGIIAGSLFSQNGNDKLMYDVDFETRYSLFRTAYFYIRCTVPDYYAECFIFADINEIPKKHSHLTVFEAAGRKLYFVVMPVSTEPPFNEEARFQEEVRVLLEKDYDEVEIVDLFELKYENTLVDFAFIAKTNKGIILGSLFSYAGENKLYYTLRYQMPYSKLENPYSSKLLHIGFIPTFDKDRYIECDFYIDQTDVPNDYAHLTAVQVGEKTLYIVITGVLDECPYI